MAPPIIDIVGQRFCRWLVIARGTRKYGWLCRCDCGAEREVARRFLVGGESKSCGCLMREVNGARIGALRASHRMTDTRTYTTWCLMKTRCTNPDFTGYQWYGARGITVCQRWLDSFDAFLEDMGERPEGMSIDRINVNGNYEPGNCRWATPKQQRRNARHSKLTEADAASIRARLDAGEKPAAIARSVGVAWNTVAGIRDGKYWR